jgi:hypothetical protein
MSRLTIFLARLIGLSAILIVLGFLMRGPGAIDATISSGPVMLAYAIISVALGLAMVLGHNVWSGGALPIVVTIVGWLILAKGLLLLALPPGSIPDLLGQMHYNAYYYFYFVPAFVVGIYLTWAGFTSSASRNS